MTLPMYYRANMKMYPLSADSGKLYSIFMQYVCKRQKNCLHEEPNFVFL